MDLKFEIVLYFGTCDTEFFTLFEEFYDLRKQRPDCPPKEDLLQYWTNGYRIKKSDVGRVKNVLKTRIRTLRQIIEGKEPWFV